MHREARPSCGCLHRPLPDTVTCIVKTMHVTWSDGCMFEATPSQHLARMFPNASWSQLHLWRLFDPCMMWPHVNGWKRPSSFTQCERNENWLPATEKSLVLRGGLGRTHSCSLGRAMIRACATAAPMEKVRMVPVGFQCPSVQRGVRWAHQ